LRQTLKTYSKGAPFYIASEWNESTRRRLRSSVFQTLAQAGFIESTKTLKLQPVHIAPQVLRYLTELQRHAAELSKHPAAWMAWNYRETLAQKSSL